MVTDVTILLVDDDPQFRELVAQYLEEEREEFETVGVTRAADALESLARDDPVIDCLVTDVVLPGMDGIALLENVREDHPHLPVIVFTGKGSEAVAADAISAGATDYIQKESGTSQYTILANRIANAVEQHRSRRRIELGHRAMDTASEGLSLVEPDGTFSYVNPAFADLFGYDPEELIGQEWTVLYDEGEATRLENEILPAVLEHGHWNGETVRETRAGQRLVTDHRLSHTEDGVIVCTATDLTAERTEPQPQTTDLELALDAMGGHGYYALDHEGYVTRWNDGAKRLTGYDADEVIGTHMEVLFTEDERANGRPEELVEAAKERGSVIDEGHRIRKDGSHVALRTIVSASYDAEGTIRGFGSILFEPSTDETGVAVQATE